VRDDEGGYAGGTYRLVVEHGAASVERADATPELTMEVAELGALYLGGRSAHELWRAGRIDAERGVVRRADRLFRTTVPPWCPEVF
jgi:predicted acetyltransferase